MRFAAFASLLALSSALVAQSEEPSEPLEIRLGWVAYEQSEVQAARYRELFERIGAQMGRRVRLRAAPGTYAEALHWIAHGLVDLAVLPPGAFAALRAQQPRDEALLYTYLASEALPPSAQAWAHEARRDPGPHFTYRSVALVRADSELKTAGDLKRLAAADNVRFLFVDRLSAGGCLAPRAALARMGVASPADAIDYSYGHSRSLEDLTARPAGEPRATVAFVYDGVRPALADSSLLRALPLDELHELEIPADVWVTRAGFAEAALLRKALLDTKDESGAALFGDLSDQLDARFAPVQAWMNTPELQPDAPVDLNEIVTCLRHFARAQGRPPRLALVFSGGGAKCSYQVGAAGAIEAALAQARAEHTSEPWLDVKLVAGTSGGAINALPVAMGVARTPEGRTRFAEVWTALDLRRMVRPAGAVCALIGLWLAGVYVLLAVSLLGLAARSRIDPPTRRWVYPLMAVLAATGLFVLVLPWVPTTWCGTHRPLRYLGLYWSFGLRWLWLFVPLAAAAAWFIRTRAPERRMRLRRIAGPLAFTMLIAIPMLTALMAAFSERTLFYGSGIEAVLGEGFAKLSAEFLPDAAAETATPAERLRGLSRQFMERHLVQRDLVITGNCLPPAHPADRYFYLAGAQGDAPPPSFGKLGVDLAGHPALLMDVVMGSGTIYPVFPARTLHDFPHPGAQTELIDGGFAHNSPIEAAVLWGATHVILIEASPLAETKGAGAHFLESSLGAFNYLYDQAQLADARSKEQAVIFTLRPKPPHLYVLDFAPAHIEAAIEKGRAQAEGATFQRQSGPPHFVSD